MKIISLIMIILLLLSNICVSQDASSNININIHVQAITNLNWNITEVKQQDQNTIYTLQCNMWSNITEHNDIISLEVNCNNKKYDIIPSVVCSKAIYQIQYSAGVCGNTPRKILSTNFTEIEENFTCICEIIVYNSSASDNVTFNLVRQIF